MQLVQTVSLPDAQLLADLQPLPDGINAVVWDMKTSPQEAGLGGIDGVVLPYMGGSKYLDELAGIDSLKFVQTQSTGYDGVIEAVGPGVAVSSASGVHAASTAELAIALILAKLRGIDNAVRDQMKEQWRPARYTSLADRRVLLVGVGGIGQEIARRLAPFEVEVTRVGSTSRHDEHGEVFAATDLVELAPGHEVLVTVLPLNAATHQLIGRAVLDALPDGALVVNVGRGPTVDTEALSAEVVSGRLHCALDVVDPEPLPTGHPLWVARNSLITPHNGGNTSAFKPRILRLLRQQLQALANGEKPANLVQAGPFR